jgi:hypothetical protein
LKEIDQNGKTSWHDKKDRQEETEASQEKEAETKKENQISPSKMDN